MTLTVNAGQYLEQWHQYAWTGSPLTRLFEARKAKRIVLAVKMRCVAERTYLRHGTVYLFREPCAMDVPQYLPHVSMESFEKSNFAVSGTSSRSKYLPIEYDSANIPDPALDKHDFRQPEIRITYCWSPCSQSWCYVYVLWPILVLVTCSFTVRIQHTSLSKL